MKSSEEVKIAISCFGDEIAPCFSATRRFRVWKLGPLSKIDCSELTVEEPGSLARIRLLKQLGVNVLICNGIEEQARQLLETSGCHVVENVTGSATESLYEYLAGNIQNDHVYNNNGNFQIQPHTSSLVDWTLNLFHSHGWTIDRLTEADSYPIDLKATIQCPACKKTVRVAICCGAHSFGVESEIQEFCHVTRREYHARVYVHFATQKIVNKCHDYEVELLDPASINAKTTSEPHENQLPPLKGRIRDHEKINIEQIENQL